MPTTNPTEFLERIFTIDIAEPIRCADPMTDEELIEWLEANDGFQEEIPIGSGDDAGGNADFSEDGAD